MGDNHSGKYRPRTPWKQFHLTFTLMYELPTMTLKHIRPEALTVLTFCIFLRCTECSENFGLMSYVKSNFPSIIHTLATQGCLKHEHKTSFAKIVFFYCKKICNIVFSFLPLSKQGARNHLILNKSIFENILKNVLRQHRYVKRMTLVKIMKLS